MKIRITKEPERYFIQLLDKKDGVLAYSQGETVKDGLFNLMDVYGMLEDIKTEELQKKVETRLSRFSLLKQKVFKPFELII